MRVRQVMSVGVVTIGADERASAARMKMRDQNIRHLVVIEDGRLAGIVSERDIGGPRATAQAYDPPVREIMATDVVSVSPVTTLRQAANLMRGRTIGCLLVLEKDRVIGLITTTDLLHHLGGGTIRPAARTEQAPLRRPPGSGMVRGGRAPRGPTGPRRGRRARRAPAQRAAFPAQVSRVVKRVRGRTLTLPPAHVRVIGGGISEEDRGKIAEKLGSRLGKFASSIERVSVRLSDVNGPRGGVDHRCLIKVVLTGLPSIVVDKRDSALQGAINSAIDATALAVRRAVQRRRMMPRRGR